MLDEAMTAALGGVTSDPLACGDECCTTLVGLRRPLRRAGRRRPAAAMLRGLGVAGRRATRGERDQLTARKREVLRLIAGGLSNPEIAERLVIAPKTAEHHVRRVLAKRGVRSRVDTATHAVREGL